MDVKTKLKHNIDLGVVAGVILMVVVFSMIIAYTVAIIEYSKNDTIKNRIEVIEGGNRQSILYDRYTKVMYLWDYRGGYTVMVDADGNPLLYEGE